MFFLSDSYQTNTVTPVLNPEPAFVNGEELQYSLHYGIITAGMGSVTLSNDYYKGIAVFHSVVKAGTTGLAEKLFKVLDIYESYFIPSSNLPLKAIRNVHEGNYKQFIDVEFDHEKNIVTSSKLPGEHKVPANILDIVSSLYYLRRIDFTNYKYNDVILVNTYFGDELFPFYIVFKGRQTIENSMGKFKCLKFVPVVEPGRIFKNKDDMTFWLSDDLNKIPVSIKFDLIVGSFKCDLVSYKNQKYNLTSMVK